MDFKFSIIVPIYEVEKYLNECVESIIKQSYKNIEIILVDDGSSDKCPALCDKYQSKDERIKVIHKKNGGLVSARKAGAEIATGDFVCCVDGDDFIDNDYIFKMNEILNSYDVDMVCCGYHLATQEKTEDIHVNAKAGLYTKEDIKKYIFPYLILSEKGEYFLPTVWAKAIKRDLYVYYQNKVSDRISIGEDGACIIPCIIEASSIYILNDCLYYYRYNTMSMTKNKKVIKWDGQIEIAKHLDKVVDLSNSNFKEQWYRRVEKGFFNVAIRQFNRKESYRIIRKDILEQYGNWPFDVAIKSASFSAGRLKTIDFIIKHKLIFFLRILNRFK